MGQWLLSLLLRSEILKVAKAEQVETRYIYVWIGNEYKILNMTETRLGGRGLQRLFICTVTGLLYYFRLAIFLIYL